MTVTEFGHDGTTYLFDYADFCAYTWSPDGTGPAAGVAGLIDELSSNVPSESKLLSISKSINQLDTPN